MFDPRFPWLAIGALSVVAGAFTLYYGAIIAGLYKNPLLESLRSYGSAPNSYPVCRFLYALSIWSLLVSSMFDALTQTSATFAHASYLPVIFFTLAIACLVSALVVRRAPALRGSLPRWHAYLLQTTTRLERRLIAYAWLRLPPKMRWRLNGNQAAWRVWVDMVRITVTYGAEDRGPGDLPHRALSSNPVHDSRDHRR